MMPGPHGVDLKEGLVENYDFMLIYHEAYAKLKTWYTSDGKEFPRTVISLGTGNQVFVVRSRFQ
jgi:hypothetical protein